jgi:hypothetical protein
VASLARSDEPTAASWHWVFIALSLGILIAATIEFALGKGAWVARASTTTTR